LRPAKGVDSGRLPGNPNFALGVASAVGVGLTALGQGLLLLLEPRTRAAGTFVTRSGPALLAPDSHWYLANSQVDVALTELGWTTWGYLALLRIGHLLGDAATFAVVTQVGLTAATAATLFAFIRQRHGPLAGIGAAAALTVNPMTAQWVRFVLTESVFQPLIVLCLLLAARVAEKATVARCTLLVGLGLVAALLRPNGVLVLAACTAVIALSIAAPRRRRLALAATITMVPVLLIASLDATGQPGEAELAEQWYSGVVIEGTDEVRITIRMPPPDDPTDFSEAALLRYAAKNPLDSMRLVASRIGVEIAQVRPHYPRTANLIVGLGIALYLVSASIGALSGTSAYLRRLTAIFATPHIVLVGVTFAVPEARYGWSGLIVLAPLVGIGAARILAAGSRVGGAPPEERDVTRASEPRQNSALDREPPP